MKNIINLGKISMFKNWRTRRFRIYLQVFYPCIMTSLYNWKFSDVLRICYNLFTRAWQLYNSEVLMMIETLFIAGMELSINVIFLRWKSLAHTFQLFNGLLAVQAKAHTYPNKLSSIPEGLKYFFLFANNFALSV